jgi:NADPH:quinone reductase-like Zn-dependent oxidoreductase
MHAVLLEQFGEPGNVLTWQQIPDPPLPARGELLVRMRYTPINPSDLLVARGAYGQLPQLPATLGFEGCGVIERSGGGVLAKLRGLRPGRRVAVLGAPGGTWRPLVPTTVRRVVPLPDDIADEQAAAFFVNPATVLALVDDVLKVQPGEWLLQTAAASTLGRMIIRLGQHAGFHTINVVRRPAQADELRQAGASNVVCTDDADLPAKLHTLCGGAHYAVDAVGGATGGLALASLRHGGRLLLYGTLSGEPLPVESRLVMRQQLRVEGFWLGHWATQQRSLRMLRLFRRITMLLRAGVLTSPVASVVPASQVRDAVRAAEQPGRVGKVLLDWTRA